MEKSGKRKREDADVLLSNCNCTILTSHTELSKLDAATVLALAKFAKLSSEKDSKNAALAKIRAFVQAPTWTVQPEGFTTAKEILQFLQALFGEEFNVSLFQLLGRDFMTSLARAMNDFANRPGDVPDENSRVALGMRFAHIERFLSASPAVSQPVATVTFNLAQSAVAATASMQTSPARSINSHAALPNASRYHARSGES